MNSWPETVSVAPSVSPANVPVIAPVPVLLMIVNDWSLAGVNDGLSVTLSVALARLMVPPTDNWL